ncbi:hypothetical protein VitviT2T_022018 [Vitis vinifera]|uniref:Uncharacterized protein n=1 Tax=Vitis vinifera TaxID=29760 RepID=A0ABY9DAV9_VITVI|nr:hypothetical protein VitviT2T_022018 [Vitis vinifera]
MTLVHDSDSPCPLHWERLPTVPPFCFGHSFRAYKWHHCPWVCMGVATQFVSLVSGKKKGSIWSFFNLHVLLLVRLAEKWGHWP